MEPDGLPATQPAPTNRQTTLGRDKSRRDNAFMATHARRRPSSPDSKSAKIRALLASGMAAGAIAKQVGCSRNLVYVVKSNAKAGRETATKRRGPGRPGKTPSVAAAGLDGILAAVKNSEREREALRAALFRIRDTVAAALHS